MNQNDLAKRLGVKTFATDILRLQVSVSESEALNIRDQFASMFGNGLVYSAESRFHMNREIQDKSVFVVESAITLDSLDSRISEIKNLVSALKIITGVSSILLQVNSWTYPL